MALRKDILVLLGLTIITTGLVIVALVYFNPAPVEPGGISEFYEYERPQLVEIPDTLSEELTELAELENTLTKELFEGELLAAESNETIPETSAPLEGYELVQRESETAYAASAHPQRLSVGTQTAEHKQPEQPKLVSQRPLTQNVQEQAQSTQKQQTYQKSTQQKIDAKPQQKAKLQSTQVSEFSRQYQSIVHSDQQYWIQLLATPNRAQLERARNILKKSNIPSIIKLYPLRDLLFYRLRVGPFGSEAEAVVIMDTILENEILNDGFIVSVNN